MTTDKLKLQINTNTKAIRGFEDIMQKLRKKNYDLKYMLRLTRAERFETIEKNFGTKRKPDMHMVKYMIYKEFFKDEDTGKAIGIDRYSPVEIDGIKCDERWNQFEFEEETTVP